MPTIDVNDTTLHVERAGEGPAILFVHGMCGDAEVWADQARRLEDRYTCVRYDRRGHSRSARGDAPVSDALHADDAAALIEALGLAPCLLVGSSGGGRRLLLAPVPGPVGGHRRGPQGPLPRQRRHRLHRPAVAVTRRLGR